MIGYAVAILDRRKRRDTRNDKSQILVLMIEHIGDIIVSVPFLRVLRAKNPDAHITIVTSRSAWPLLEYCPLIDDLIVADKSGGWHKQLIRSFKLGLKLRTIHADLAIVPKDAPNEDFNELICLLAACRKRISRVRPQLSYRIKPLKFAPFYDRIVIDKEVRHESYQRYRIVQDIDDSEALTKLEAWLSSEDHEYADQFLGSIGLAKNDILICIGIGASAAGRCWPLENYARVIEALARHYSIKALAIIGPSEVNKAKELGKLTDYPVHYSTEASVRQSLALIKHGTIFIGNDSGPMHMAAAMGIPVVEISTHPKGATPWSINSPERFGAYGVPTRILRPTPKDSRCTNGCISGFAPHCINNITTDEVIQAANELLRLNTSSGQARNFRS